MYVTITAPKDVSFRSAFVGTSALEYISINANEDGFADNILTGVSDTATERFMFDDEMDITVDGEIEQIDPNNGNKFWLVRNKKRKQS